MKEYKIVIKFPIECDFLECCESDAEALRIGKDMAKTDAVELAGTRGIKTWDNIWNKHIDEILDMSLEDSKNFVDSKYTEYLDSIIDVTVEEV